jgi:flagellar biogenesis protein FliO
VTRYIAVHFLILVFSFAVFASSSMAQSANAQPQTGPSPEAMNENDRIPFMQTEPTAEAPESSSGTLLIKTLGSLLLIVGLIFAGSWGVRKLGLGGRLANTSDGDVELTVLSTVSLGSGRTISTVRFGERVLVIGSTPQAVTLLAEDAKSFDPGRQHSRSVAEMLATNELSFENQFENARFRVNEWEAEGESSL